MSMIEAMVMNRYYTSSQESLPGVSWRKNAYLLLVSSLLSTFLYLFPQAIISFDFVS